MTKSQQKFYNIIVNQCVDYEAIFHDDFTIKRIEQISDNNLKYLLEDINIDKDKIGKSKGYITYVKLYTMLIKLLTKLS